MGMVFSAKCLKMQTEPKYIGSVVFLLIFHFYFYVSSEL